MVYSYFWKNCVKIWNLWVSVSLMNGPNINTWSAVGCWCLFYNFWFREQATLCSLAVQRCQSVATVNRLAGGRKGCAAMRKTWKACLKRGSFQLLPYKEKTVTIIFLQKVECKPWLKIFLINKTNITLKFISLVQSGRDIDYTQQNFSSAM